MTATDEHFPAGRQRACERPVSQRAVCLQEARLGDRTVPGQSPASPSPPTLQEPQTQLWRAVTVSHPASECPPWPHYCVRSPLPPCDWERQLSKSPPLGQLLAGERMFPGQTVELTRLLPSRPGVLCPKNVVSRGSWGHSAPTPRTPAPGNGRRSEGTSSLTSHLPSVQVCLFPPKAQNVYSLALDRKRLPTLDLE